MSFFWLGSARRSDRSRASASGISRNRRRAEDPARLRRRRSAEDPPAGQDRSRGDVQIGVRGRGITTTYRRHGDISSPTSPAGRTPSQPAPSRNLPTTIILCNSKPRETRDWHTGCYVSASTNQRKGLNGQGDSRRPRGADFAPTRDERRFCCRMGRARRRERRAGGQPGIHPRRPS